VSNPTDKLMEHYVKLTLSADLRAQIYTTLALLLENKVQLIKALEKLYEVYSDEGKNRYSAPAIFIADAHAIIREGKPLSAAFARYISTEEASIIQAGERSGRLREAFRDAIENIKRKQAIRAAIVGGATYPAILAIMLCVMLYIVSSRLMPTLAKAVDLDALTGSAAILRALSSGFTNYGVAAGVVLAGFVAWVAWSMPRLTGKLRVRLDRLPPWSVYRASNGSAFLLNVAVMVQSGIKLLDALQQLFENANPYMQERIGAAIQGIQRGRNLGEALADSELEFPDRKAVRLVQLLAGNSGFEESLQNFAVQWADESVARVKASMKVFFMVGIMATGGMAVLIVSSTADIQSAIEQSTQQ
jgi:type II secretory pathway component PulF